MPERLGASGIDKNGDKVTPVMIHRAVLGSLSDSSLYYLSSTLGVTTLVGAKTNHDHDYYGQSRT